MDFLFVAEHPALDFVNTELWEDGRVDRLQRDADVWAWAQAAGLDARRDERPVLAEARALRTALRSVLEAEARGEAPDAARLAAIDTAARQRPGLIHADDAYVRAAPVGGRQLLAVVAYSALELLESNDRARLHACEGKQCILLFVDRSRSGNRRWCSMQICGNRRKVRAHRARS